MKAPQDIIIAPVITEKSMSGIADKKYTFKVAKDANKIEIAKAVEELVKANGGCCICEVNNTLKAIPFEEALTMHKDQVKEKMKVFKELW